MKFHLDESKQQKEAKKREAELAEAMAFLQQKAKGQVEELKEVIQKQTRED